jgi:hypothetical protein
MAPRAPPGHKADSIVTELWKQGAIGKSMFSMYLGDLRKQQDSKIWFGGWDNSFIRSFNGISDFSDEEIGELIAWIPLSSEYYW